MIKDENLRRLYLLENAVKNYGGGVSNLIKRMEVLYGGNSKKLTSRDCDVIKDAINYLKDISVLVIDEKDPVIKIV